MPLGELLSADRIAILVEPGNRAAVLETAARLLADDIPGSTGAALVSTIADSLRARERLASTAIGHGVAIPHGRLPGLEASRGAFLRLAQPVEFDAADGQRVDLVMALAVPEHYVQQHLAQLAEIAEHFASEAFRNELRRATSASQLSGLLLAGSSRKNVAGAVR
ncbi:PTS sugar transporter subunit IIA [Novilysobacter selenitireducens]|uniref:PTS sugar transporter subunit IIA n=1 Tax=Novilysobacter selenitireducens TaxID=2872639 RepID=A0ABS7T6G0_9GAMM|nr:PTS sugar transporter subunit IIA [Lysobacter selenitireducens]MBZ4039452.1 PTS sugar transporter subunit IIA [Lysobacter selenitireducens]